MKIFNQVNRLRHVVRIILAVILALLLNHYFSFTHQGWLVLATLVVMLTSTGSAFYQGLWRFFALIGLILVGSIAFSSWDEVYLRMNDIALGSVLGILMNVLVLPDRIDHEFRRNMIIVLHSYGKYFSGIVELFLLRQTLHAEMAKRLVEEELQQLPGWVYEMGFDITLQKGYRYFFMKTNQISEMLFAMHFVARHSFDDTLLAKISEPLLRCVDGVNSFVVGLTTVLDLKPLQEGVVDFADDIAEIERIVFKSMPIRLELIDADKQFVLLAEWVYGLRELHDALMKLAKALR